MLYNDIVERVNKDMDKKIDKDVNKKVEKDISKRSSKVEKTNKDIVSKLDKNIDKDKNALKKVNKVKNDSDNKENSTVDSKINKENKKVEKDVVVVRKSTDFNIIEVVVIIIITGIVTSVCSGLIVYNNYDKIYISTSEDDKTDLNEFVESYDHIVNSYVKEVDRSKLIEAAIAGMYSYLEDDYSIYMNKDTTSSLQEQLEGKYTGIGVEITLTDKEEIVINQVFSDSPAMKAGLKKGDVLIKLDDVYLKDQEFNYMSNTIKNGDKDKYTLTYMRDGKEYSTTLTRSSVTIDSVKSEVYDNVGYIQIETFSATTSDLVKKHLDSFDSSVKSLVIDLRDNTGGYLSSAFDTSSIFLEKGSIVYQIKDRKSKVSKYKSEEKMYRKFDNIAIIVNNATASASEVLTLALKDNLGAKVVGVKSFGKGTVQETEKLSSGAMVKYTSGYWLGPKGESINEKGIEPDYEVKEKDKQLEKAIEIVK